MGRKKFQLIQGKRDKERERARKREMGVREWGERKRERDGVREWREREGSKRVERERKYRMKMCCYYFSSTDKVVVRGKFHFGFVLEMTSFGVRKGDLTLNGPSLWLSSHNKA